MPKKITGFHLADEDEARLQAITSATGWTRSQAVRYWLAKATVDSQPQLSVSRPMGDVTREQM
jgi:hypothetical protein